MLTTLIDIIKLVNKSKLSSEITSFNPIRSGGGGAFKALLHPKFGLTHLILELHSCALVTFPSKWFFTLW